VKRLKKPELKLSELKVPPVLRDLYQDLRDRRLLPLVGLVLVAIVAVPFLLGGGGEAKEPDFGSIPGGSSSEPASLAVLPATPGLRDPGKRLAGRSTKNPFRQQYTAPVIEPGAAAITETSTSIGGDTSSGSTSVESSGGGPSPAPEPAPSPGNSSAGGKGKKGSDDASPPGDQGDLQIFTFAIDLKLAHTEVGKDGKRTMGEAETREEVLPTTPLPGKKTPVLTYLGVDPEKGEEALMLVSPDVTSLFGDGKCVSGTATCQLLALKPGTPEIVEYSDNGARYKFEVLKIKPVASGSFDGDSKK
jgi:hypothetical protein